MGNRSILKADAEKLAYLHPSCDAVEEPHPSLWETDITMGLARCQITEHFKQNRKKLIEHETEKGISTLGDKTSTGCVGSLSVVGQVSQVKGPFLCTLVGVKRLLFQTF